MSKLCGRLRKNNQGRRYIGIDNTLYIAIVLYAPNFSVAHLLEIGNNIAYHNYYDMASTTSDNEKIIEEYLHHLDGRLNPQI